jgi:hypothetical protein
MFTTTNRSRKIASLAGRVGVVAAALGCATQSGNAQAQPMRSQAGPYELEVLVDGAPARTFFHGGETYVLGHLGARYTLRVHNRSGVRVEAVVSVDGRDVVDGKTADFRKRGYLVPAWGTIDIDGWRLSTAQVAAFRFTSVPDSYAARMGNPRNVGVIGVAVFPERVWRPQPPRPLIPYRTYPPYPPYPGAEAEGGYRDDSYSYGGGRAPAAEPPAARSGAGGSGRVEAPAPEPPATPPSPAQAQESAPAAPRAAAPADGALADAESRRARGGAPYRPGLGTQFGESMYSGVREVSFVRAHASRPAAILGARYNDRAGLIALGIDVDGWPHYGSDDLYLRGTARPFPVSHGPYAAPPPGWRR